MHILLILILLALIWPGFVRGLFRVIGILFLLVLLALWLGPPSHAETVRCTTTFQGYRVCSGNEGYQSFETPSQGYTVGHDNRGNDWMTGRDNRGNVYIQPLPRQ